MKVNKVVEAFKTLDELGVPLTSQQIEACSDEILRTLGLSKAQLRKLLSPQSAVLSNEDAQRMALLSQLYEIQNVLEREGGKTGKASIAMGHDRQWISDTVLRVLLQDPSIREIPDLHFLIQTVESNTDAKKK